MKTLRSSFIFAILFAVISAPMVFGDHVVSTSELQQAVEKSSVDRQQQERKLIQFLSNPAAQDSLAKANIDQASMKTAVSALSDEELAQLAAKADKTNHDFAAGALSNSELTFAVLALAFLVVILALAI